MALVESFSGIRGLYGDELTEDIASKYAYAYFREFLFGVDKIKVVIGRDSRENGKNLFKAIVKSLNCEIIDLGVCATSIIEHAVRAFSASGGIIITGSHNEPEYNGIKFLDKDGAILRPKDIERVIKKFHEIKDSDIKIEFTEHVINEKKDQALYEYLNLVKSLIDRINMNFSIVVDPNGGAGIDAKKIFDEFGIKASYINMEKGKFNRLIEPKLESLEGLKDEINKTGSDFAIGFDCDADRVEILLDNGELVSGNEILAIIVEDILASLDKGQIVVVNDATSYLVKEIAEKFGGKFKEVEVGEINVVDSMNECNSPIGGEGSNGGVIISPTKCRDGILTILYLLKILEKREKSLKEVINELPKYYYIKEKFNLKKDFKDIREKVKKYYIDKNYKILESGDETGGLKAISDNGWVWFRQSKTEDKVLRIIVDSKNKEFAEKSLEEGKEVIGL